MDKETLDAFGWRLTVKLWDELYFFIPDNGVFRKVFGQKEYFKENKVLDTILVMDYYQGPMYYKEDRNKLKVFTKSEILRKNLYGLFEKQQTLGSSAFKFVLDEYYKQLDFFLFLSKWMHENIKDHIKMGKVPEGIFYYQYMTYKTHMEALVKQFYPTRKEVPQSTLNSWKDIDTNFKEIDIGLKRMPLVNFDVGNTFKKSKGRNTIIAKRQQGKITPTTKKRPLLESCEAENELLKSVFKVKTNR